MVANIPIERPNTYDALTNKIADLQAQVDALTRQSKYPFVVSHDPGIVDFSVVPDTGAAGGANLTVNDGAGGPLLRTFTGAGGQKTSKLYDQSGHIMWGTDEVAGYGLSEPTLSYGMSTEIAGNGNQSMGVNTENTVMVGGVQAYNPAVLCSITIYTLITNYDFRVTAQSGATTVSTSITTGLNSTSAITKMLLLPATFMNAPVTLRALVTPRSASGTAWVSCSGAYGIGKGYYDLNPGLH
ncbi:hypothetical protein [Amycolatopsis sp. H20-H5]|uniref:hypothetical protein n=1 Tax=Amycolatopsis sp. H20-H5 TaxID=3046309 RepID=UPI002DB9ACED|nr:hypothetical protein [Amycolatopsis sp. H20-H5]MEC3974730.1 hypothetical protein [Amycolatopsis sp. H20-H5]